MNNFILSERFLLGCVYLSYSGFRIVYKQGFVDCINLAFAEMLPRVKQMNKNRKMKWINQNSFFMMVCEKSGIQFRIGF